MYYYHTKELSRSHADGEILSRRRGGKPHHNMEYETNKTRRLQSRLKQVKEIKEDRL